MSFEGKSVLVTGGSRGIGKAISLRFAGQGARRVAVSYLRNDKAAEETADEINGVRFLKFCRMAVWEDRPATVDYQGNPINSKETNPQCAPRYH